MRIKAVDLLPRGIQKLSKISLLPTKEIHNFITLLTLTSYIPLRAVANGFINITHKDIHSANSQFCR